MNITESNSVVCNSVEQYLNIVLNGEYKTLLFFRGESKLHKYVIPNLYLSKELTKTSSEDYYRKLFSQLGHDDYSDSASLFRVISEFQHYGAKTRILDITTNPLVALYFAVEKFYGEKVPDVKIGEMDATYPCEDGIVYLFDGKPIHQKYDTGHTVAIKSALNLLSQAIIDNFFWVCESLKEDWGEAWETIKWYRLASAVEMASDISVREMSPREYHMIRRFMDLLNQRAKSHEELVYPFEVFEDLNKSHIVIPSKCTDRIKQQQGAFIFPKYLNTYNKELSEIQNEIDLSVSSLLAQVTTPVDRKSICAIKIPGKHKENIKKELSKLGITEGFIYPEIKSRSNSILESLS